MNLKTSYLRIIMDISRRSDIQEKEEDRVECDADKYVKDVIKEVDDEKSNTDVSEKYKFNIDVGDQVVDDQNSYPLEMVVTKICVKEEPSLLQVDHIDLSNWVLLTRDDFIENIPSNIRAKEEVFVDSPDKLILSVANWEVMTPKIEESSEENDARRNAAAHESTNGHHLKALIGQHSSLEGNFSGLVDGPHEEEPIKVEKKISLSDKPFVDIMHDCSNFVWNTFDVWLQEEEIIRELQAVLSMKGEKIEYLHAKLPSKYLFSFFVFPAKSWAGSLLLWVCKILLLPPQCLELEMADDGVDMAPPSTRPMNFVSEEQLGRSQEKSRCPYAELNERVKHRPPKAVDEDETEFLEKLETSKREYKRRMADQEAHQLQSFLAAVLAAQSAVVHEALETLPVPEVQEKRLVGRKNPPAHPSGMITKVKPHAKKAKIDMGSLDAEKSPSVDTEKHLDSVKLANGDADEPHVVANTGLVSCSDDSDEDYLGSSDMNHILPSLGFYSCRSLLCAPHALKTAAYSLLREPTLFPNSLLRICLNPLPRRRCLQSSTLPTLPSPVHQQRPTTILHAARCKHGYNMVLAATLNLDGTPDSGYFTQPQGLRGFVAMEDLSEMHEKIADSNGPLHHQNRALEEKKKALRNDSSSANPKKGVRRGNASMLEGVSCFGPMRGDNYRGQNSLANVSKCFEDQFAPLQVGELDRNADVSETSMVDSMSGAEISPDDVVGDMGQK
ncbi:hypothetical protein RHSIM_Rhsim01G0086800 [Rhododendron simsii]|uniref:FAM192A/Fyv6 N-terminal domain-containing protein n=1 Tax=Rhododendron simsii TaxID=118357 RepID=A0A834HGE3_RHOSS|nr:hypothetical protein RHSIM_Rhsim01G0086800 [Rhododendron simsii]